MKLMYFFSFTLLLTPGLCAHKTANEPENITVPESTSSKQPNQVQDYNDPIQFMSDFLDISVKPDQPLKYWAIQLFLLLRTNPRMKKFRNEIIEIAKDQTLTDAARAEAISSTFIRGYRDQLFSTQLSNFILSRMGTLSQSINMRCKR